MKDCWHFITKDGFIFTTRGDIHPEGFVRAAGVYYPDENGNRNYNGRKYLKKVDEYGEGWVKKEHPDYIIKNEKGSQILVPVKNIERYFNPFEVSEEKREIMKKTKWGGLINTLEELIPKKDIGFIGSYLIGFSIESSDIDIVINGVDNLKKIKQNFGYILERLNADNNLDEYLKEISLQKYYNLYSKDKNDFFRMIQNRWPTIRTNKYMTKLRFIPKPGEIEFPRLNKKIGDVEVKGKVIEDIGTNFMPRFFKINTEKGEYSVMTYFWDYTYCVKENEDVTVNGSLFEDKVIAINDKYKHGIKFD